MSQAQIPTPNPTFERWAWTQATLERGEIELHSVWLSLVHFHPNIHIYDVCIYILVSIIHAPQALSHILWNIVGGGPKSGWIWIQILKSNRKRTKVGEGSEQFSAQRSGKLSGTSKIV